MAKRIHDGELDLGVLHGIEFAWTRKDFPNLQALVIVYNETYKLRGYVVVRADSGYESCADLKGKAVAWPKYNLNHTYLFTHHIVKETGCDPTGFFAPGEPVPSTEGSLDHVYDKKAAAAVVDGLAWNFYRGEKPGRAARLKIMKESEIFPTATIIYNPRAADDKVMDKVYKGLTSAHERVIGRQMLTLWRVTNFSKVPEEYEQMLTDVLKVFPEPVQPAAFMPAPVEKATATGGMN
jgi:ABC-type phosphate/phosphonate transport system substrate-binding protein